jgi:hypothetical protein
MERSLQGSLGALPATREGESVSEMASDEAIDSYLEDTAKAEAPFFEAYGRAVLAWAELEDMQVLLFRQMTGMPPNIARPVFYSAKSYSARADMFEAAISPSHLSDPEKRLAQVLCRKARSYCGFRNHIVHENTVCSSIRHKEGYDHTIHIQAPKHPKTAPDVPKVNLVQLENAKINFRSLTYCFLYAVMRVKTPAGQEVLDLCQARVLELPKLPESPPAGRSVVLPPLPEEASNGGGIELPDWSHRFSHVTHDSTPKLHPI